MLNAGYGRERGKIHGGGGAMPPCPMLATALMSIGCDCKDSKNKRHGIYCKLKMSATRIHKRLTEEVRSH